MNFEEIMQRAVNVEAKASLKSSIIIWDLDIYCSGSHRSFNSTALKMQTQGTTVKDSSRPKKPKVKETKSIRANAVEPLEQDKKDKKDWGDKKRSFRKKKKRSNTLVTGNNAIDALKKKKKNRDCDISEVTCYNFNKKEHFAKTCIKPKN